MLAAARSSIVRFTPAEAAAARDVLLVDLRSVDERERTGVNWVAAGLPVE